MSTCIFQTSSLKIYLIFQRHQKNSFSTRPTLINEWAPGKKYKKERPPSHVSPVPDTHLDHYCFRAWLTPCVKTRFACNIISSRSFQKYFIRTLIHRRDKKILQKGSGFLYKWGGARPDIYGGAAFSELCGLKIDPRRSLPSLHLNGLISLRV